MRVGIDATCWSNPRGYGRYTRGLLTALLANTLQHEFILFVDRQTQTQTQWPFPSNAQTVVAETSQAPTVAASADGQRSLPDLLAMTRAVARTPLEVFFFPSLYTYFPVVTRAKILVGVHDVIVDDYPDLVFPDRWRRLLWQLKAWLAHRQAGYIVTVSEHAKHGILRHFHHRPNRTWVVGEAADPIFQPIGDEQFLSTILERFGLQRSTPFVICLGGLNPHKNLEIVLKAVAQLRCEPEFSNLEIVLVGPAESDTFTPGAADARQLVAELNLGGAVHFTGYLPDADVAGLLNAARVLAMPSFDEGFGLGAVEAAACGTPVIATCSSPLPDWLAGGGWFIDPHQPQQLGDALREVLTDEAGRRNRGRVALAQAQRLTWQRAAGQFADLLDFIEAGK